MGLPTWLERPSTSASCPASGPKPASLISISAPEGVQAMSPWRESYSPIASRPILAGVRPSTSFMGSIAAMMRAASIVAGSGICTNIPCTAGSAFSA